MFNDEGEKICERYTVMYDGYLFYGDNDGLNCHDFDRRDDVESLIHAYGDMIEVRDNEYGVYFARGEWS